MKPIVVQDVSFRYEGSDQLTIDGIDFTVETGEIVGLLGHNGSGKTTIMNCIVGLLKPEKGSVWLAGRAGEKQWTGQENKIGFVPAHPTLYNMMTVEEFIMFMGRLHDLSVKEIRAASEPLLVLLNLQSKRRELIHTLSGGMKQKVAMIAALLHSPPALILDEPMTGYDAKSTKQMKDFLVNLVREKQTGLLLSSHRLDIVESICHKLVVIRLGKIVFKGSVAELKEQSAGSLEEAFLSITSEQEENYEWEMS